MPRRRRLTKIKKSAKRTGGDPDAPSDAEWEKMRAYGSFVGRCPIIMISESFIVIFRLTSWASDSQGRWWWGTHL